MKEVLLQRLPAYSNRSLTIAKNQTVGDIVQEVLAAHQAFATDYDAIAYDFDHGNDVDTAKILFSFLKNNVRYKVESEAKQTTKSPAAILATQTGDCKHYSGFIGGVLDALKRSGRKINWHYRFASYNVLDSLPGHVFVVLNENGKEYWIDPVLNTFNERLEPTYILDKKPKQMLQRISGVSVNQVQEFLSLVSQNVDGTANTLAEVARDNYNAETLYQAFETTGTNRAYLIDAINAGYGLPYGGRVGFRKPCLH